MTSEVEAQMIGHHKEKGLSVVLEQDSLSISLDLLE